MKEGGDNSNVCDTLKARLGDTVWDTAIQGSVPCHHLQGVTEGIPRGRGGHYTYTPRYGWLVDPWLQVSKFVDGRSLGCNGCLGPEGLWMDAIDARDQRASG